MFDIAELTTLLHAAARTRTPLTYAEVLNTLGYAFSRPKMRALCVVLTDIDVAERGAGRPGLAVLVVRASDGLPGQGWWVGRTDYTGLWVGAEALTHVREQQDRVFARWSRSSPASGSIRAR